MPERSAGIHGEDSRTFEDLRSDVRRVRVQLRQRHGPRQVRQRVRTSPGPELYFLKYFLMHLIWLRETTYSNLTLT